MRIVISNWYPFEISHNGIKRYAEIKGIELYPYCPLDRNKPSDYFLLTETDDINPNESVHWATRKLDPMTYEKLMKYEFWGQDIERNDPALIQMVEELGKESSPFSELKIIEIPDDVDFKIIFYNDSEIVIDKYRMWS
ncbi:MAG: hypothetical protein J7L96_03220 [Bacteroidales bacterium]|nr:hypothetical protein [Bacteroidales bacterium]